MHFAYLPKARSFFESADPATGNVDLFSQDPSGGPWQRQTFSPAADFYPVCSPRGSEIFFSSLRRGRPRLHRQQLGSPGSEIPINQTSNPEIPTDVSRDGQLLIYSVLKPETNWDLYVLDLESGEARALAAGPAAERAAKLSPDARWLTYISNESGRFEVYVEPFPPTGTKWQISSFGGQQPQWSFDGKQLFFLSPESRLLEVEVLNGTGSHFTVSPPRTLLDVRITGWERYGPCQYAFSSDGQRILANIATEANPAFSLALNWPVVFSR